MRRPEVVSTSCDGSMPSALKMVAMDATTMTVPCLRLEVSGGIVARPVASVVAVAVALPLKVAPAPVRSRGVEQRGRAVGGRLSLVGRRRRRPLHTLEAEICQRPARGRERSWRDYDAAFLPLPALFCLSCNPTDL
jgi:hypothetical protein